MGCGNSRSKLAAEDPSSTEKTRRQSVYAPAPEIPITVGENVKLDSSGSSSIKIVFIFGNKLVNFCMYVCVCMCEFMSVLVYVCV